MFLSRQFKLNTFYNLVGLGGPLLAALFAIPYLIGQLGETKFGLLTLIWAVVSYFGLFDLGLGRAVTQQYAQAVGSGEQHRLGEIVASANLLLLILGLFSALLMLLLAPLMSSELIGSPQGAAEVERALWMMAAAMPFIILSSGFRGIMEAQQRFALINAIRVPMGLFTYLAPVAVVLAGFKGLDLISLVLALGRFVGCGLHAYFVFGRTPSLGLYSSASGFAIRSLLATGGWMTVSNIISPLMTYLDRFLIGFVAGTAAVAYYVTPQEMVMRLAIIPAALSATLFPMFAQYAFLSAADARKSLRKYSTLLGIVMLPIAAIIVIYADWLLSIWISPEFSESSYRVLQVLALASIFNSIANVPYAYLQGTGDANAVAKIHAIELILYIPLIFVLTSMYGSLGAATAWLIRIIFDCCALFGFAYLTTSKLGSEKSEVNDFDCVNIR